MVSMRRTEVDEVYFKTQGKTFDLESAYKIKKKHS
jgi:hypothetical protein